MKRLFIYLSLAVMFFSFTQDANLILWKEGNKLSWGDFKGKPDASSSKKANTSSEISIALQVKNKVAFVGITTCFNKNNSWVKEIKTDYLLNHEQVHFDITELWARKFREKIKDKVFPLASFQNEISAIRSEIFKGNKDMQDIYDKETNHSVVAASQKKWEKKIAEDLQKLSSFSTKEVSCTLTK